MSRPPSSRTKPLSADGGAGGAGCTGGCPDPAGLRTVPAERGSPGQVVCELVGTALLPLGGLSAVCLDFGPRAPLTVLLGSPRLLITGLLFAGTATC